LSYSNSKRIPRSGEESERIGFYSIGINILLVGIKYGLAEMLAHIEPKPYTIEIFDPLSQPGRGLGLRDSRFLAWERICPSGL